ncbi:hypothetical protein ACLI08_00865 [Flavobacterium sp. RNTU_13]|uniref:hypothetical protein n=1 Tax=Flavobacterium sp. RNTU_13 TaxID=3375145 RepID=UPI0039880F49
MIKVTFYVMAFLCLAVNKMSGQTFSQKATEISNNIETITKQEKDSLKIEVDAVNLLLDKNEITAAEADKRKKEYAEKRAKNIETRVGVEEQKLADLVRDKVDGKIQAERKFHRFGFSYSEGYRNDTIKAKARQERQRRTTSQFVYALGVNRLVKDGASADGFKWRSDFYEVGLTWNTRLAKNNNLLHAKYGLSLQYNNLRPDNNRYFVKEGNQTVLADFGRNLDVARLRYVNLVVPAHLEFDFSKKRMNGDKVDFRTHESFRLGLGGYAGFNVKEKQILKYKNDGGNSVKQKTKGDYNVNDFVYGVSAYVSYRAVGVYAKYDLQETFTHSFSGYNNFSLGMRFDIN